MKPATLLLAGGAIVAALVAGHASGGSGPQALHLLDVSESATPVFRTQGPPRAGDRVFAVDGLYAWAGAQRGARVGHVDATLTFMTGFGAHGAKVDVDGQLFLPGGSIAVGGIARFSEGPSRFSLPVVGGTGRYAGARGSLSVHDITSNGDKSAFDIQLLP
jgi:hypothetical protein